MEPTFKKTKLQLSDIVQMPNVAAKLSPEELAFYGVQAVAGYDADMYTRRDWADRNAAAIKMALQYATKKSFPWNRPWRIRRSR